MSKTLDSILKEINRYENNNDIKSWKIQCDKIEEIYRNQSSRNGNPNTNISNNTMSRRSFNILWANLQTLLPAIYSRNPRPNVSRRFNGNDPVARETSLVLEKCLNYYIDNENFKNTMRESILDWNLYGRGTAWIRYEPIIKKNTIQIKNDISEFEDKEPEEEVYFENVIVDFVGYEDFGYNLANTWQEVYLVWRKVRLSKEAAEGRFKKDVVDSMSFDSPEKEIEKGSNDQSDADTASVYEVWNQKTKKIYFLQKNSQEFLDVKDDPLNLADFFPCPRPMFCNLANKNLVPVPDYQEYASQAEQLDLLAQRMYAIQRTLKVVGLYDKAADGIQKLLSGAENTLYPVNIESLIEKGGLDKMIYMFPLQETAQSLKYIYEAFNETKAHLYEITGIADILRGAGDAQETATGIRTKGQYALLRIEDKQQEAQRFIKDILRIFGEIIAEKFSPSTIYKIAGDGLLTNQQKQLLSQGVAIPELKYIDENTLKTMMNKPSFDDVMTLLRDDPARCMRIDIETDSTIKQDQEQDKNDRVEFLKSVAAYMREMIPVAQQHPDMANILSQLFMFGVRGFQIGKETEQALSDWTAQISANKQTNQSPPDPKMQELQLKSQLEMQKLEQQGELEKMKMQLEVQRETLQAQTDIAVAQKQQEFQSQDAKYQHDLDMQIQTLKIKMEEAENERQRQFELEEQNRKLAFERWKVEYESLAKSNSGEV